MGERVRFVFRGRLDEESFTAFARHRAARLALGLEVGPGSGAACEMTVWGEAPLVDAFDMACSLGPLDCIVIDVERHSAA
jgi:hypothetical protein